MRSRPLPHATCSTSQCWPSSSSANACSARCFQPRGAKVAWEPSEGTTLARMTSTASAALPRFYYSEPDASIDAHVASSGQDEGI